MIQYNVEIFDRNFELVGHTNTSGIEYSVDYLSPVNNEIIVFNCPAEKGNYIRISGNGREFFGVVCAVKSKSQKTMTIEYGDFLSVFDTHILFDTDLQGTSSLESVIADKMEEMFVNSADVLQNLTGLEVQTESQTTSWGFNLKSDTEGKHTCIINFYETILVRSLQEYGVVVRVVPDIQAKTITLIIGTITSQKTIEADLPNVLEKNVVIKETDKDVNKLVVYNTENYTENRTYYRHTDDTYDTINDRRVVPVVQEIEAVSPEYDGEIVSKPFAIVADSKAAEIFGGIKYNNLIELRMFNDDALIKPNEIKIGQKVIIRTNGNQYESILTGYTVGQTTLLTFGTIRLDLTKIIKRRVKSGG